MTEKRIQKLSPLLINQIAAGEVVTRPASVVKELLENAIDAHANHIRIDIEQGGLGLIQISDNGHGIHPDDMTLAVTRHATSKLADIGELSGIDSLGFRGEALASIAAVSHLTLTSSHDDTGIGQQLSLSGETVSHANIKPIVKNRGTTVTVRDLYYNVPARRGHLKSIATEFAHIEQVVQRLAISFADIGLELYHQNKLRFSLNSLSKSTPLKRLENALNLALETIATPFELPLTALQPIENPLKEQTAKITGWLFVTQQPQDLPKLIYINQRLVTDFAISQTIAKSVRQVGLENTNLGYALFFDLPKDWINVNIHPSKQQVKIQPLTNILALLNQALQDTLKQYLAETPLQNQESLNLAVEPDDKALTENAFSHAISSNNFRNIIQDFSKQNSNLTKDFLPSFSKSSNKNFSSQVNEFHTDYSFEVLKNTKFSPSQLFDNSPKFLKIVEKENQQFGLIFWQDVFYLLPIKNITLEILANDMAFSQALQQANTLDNEAMLALMWQNGGEFH